MYARCELIFPLGTGHREIHFKVRSLRNSYKGKLLNIFCYTDNDNDVLCDPANPKPKIDYQSFSHSVIQSFSHSVVQSFSLSVSIGRRNTIFKPERRNMVSGQNEEMRFSGQNYLHF